MSLHFRSDFEGGNLEKATPVPPDHIEWDLTIRPDRNNARHRVWFHFAVRGARPGQRVIFVVTNFSKTRSLFRHGLTPVVKSTSRPKWEKLPVNFVNYFRSPRHGNAYVLAFAFRFDSAEEHEFAYCFPYTVSDLQRQIAEWEYDAGRFLTRQLLARTPLRNRVDLLVIGSEEVKRRRREGSPVAAFFISARVHPGETPSSYVCKGLVDFLLSAHPTAVALRDSVLFYVVPMLNPDGVILGSYRCSVSGHDLNRAYLNPVPAYHEPISSLKSLITELAGDPTMCLAVYVDIHAHSTSFAGFFYGNYFDSPERQEREMHFPRAFAHACKDFSLAYSSFNREPDKAGTGRRVLGEGGAGFPHSYTLEVSFHGAHVGNSKRSAPYVQESYEEIGKALVVATADYTKAHLRKYLPPDCKLFTL